MACFAVSLSDLTHNASIDNYLLSTNSTLGVEEYLAQYSRIFCHVFSYSGPNDSLSILLFILNSDISLVMTLNIVDTPLLYLKGR